MFRDDPARRRESNCGARLDFRFEAALKRCTLHYDLFTTFRAEQLGLLEQALEVSIAAVFLSCHAPADKALDRGRRAGQPASSPLVNKKKRQIRLKSQKQSTRRNLWRFSLVDPSTRHISLSTRTLGIASIASLGVSVGSHSRALYSNVLKFLFTFFRTLFVNLKKKGALIRYLIETVVSLKRLISKSTN